jgi:RNA-directed DNA polymerase
MSKWRAVYIERCTHGSGASIRKPAAVMRQGAGCLAYFVILAHYIGKPIQDEVNRIITSLGLTMNAKKTGVVNLTQGETLTFLGYSIRLDGGKYQRIYLKPSKKACTRLRERMREVISRRKLYHGIKGIIAEINPILRGWKQYFRLPNVSRVFSDLDFHVTGRFYRVGRKTSQRLSKVFQLGAYVTLRKMGLYSLVNG